MRDAEYEEFGLDPGGGHRPLKKQRIFLIALGIVIALAWYLKGAYDLPTAPSEQERPKLPAPQTKPLNEPKLTYEPKRPELPSLLPTAKAEATPPPASPELTELIKQVLQGQQVQQAQTQLLIEAIRDMPQKPQATPTVPTPVETEQQRKQRLKEAQQEEEERKKKLKEWKPLSGGPRDDDKSKAGTVQHLKTPWSLSPNTLINFLTEAEVTNEAPGAFRAMVSMPVRDSATEEIVVIPQGAWIGLRQAGKSIFGDERMAFEVLNLSYRDKHVKLASASVGDRLGTAGFKDLIDRHWGRVLASVLITGVLRGGTSMLMTYGADPAERVAGAVGQEAANSGTRSVQQFIKTEPTLTDRPAFQGTILLIDALELSEPLVTP